MCPDGTSTDDTDDEFCDALDGGSAKFKSGSKGLDVSISYNFDFIRVYIDPCIYNSSDCDDMVLKMIVVQIVTFTFMIFLQIPCCRVHILDILEMIVM